MSAGDPSIIPKALAWRDEGRSVALATVIQTWGSAPQPVGSQLAIDGNGNFSGSVSGGCVEGDVIAEALLRGEGSARIDDHHVVTKRARRRRQRLRHMHGANDDEARRGSEHVDEHFTIAPRHCAASILAKSLGERRCQVLANILGAMRERARAGRKIGHQCYLAARGNIAGKSMQQGSIATRPLQRLEEDTDGAAASEPGLPGDFILDAELQHLGLAR